MNRSMFLAATLLAACATDKGLESDLPDDGSDKADSFAKPTDHGAIAFSSAQNSVLASSAQYHAWTFSLSNTASIHAATSRVPHDASVDTVLYLYKKQPSGTWGSYLARNDDEAGRDPWSGLTKSLSAGEYRVLVKGYTASDTGHFALQVDCTGAGCAPAAPSCFFGGKATDIVGSETLLINSQQFTAAGQGMVAVDQQRIELATGTTTEAAAFAAVDGGNIQLLRLYDLVGARSFTAVEYAQGGKLNGAIFAWNGTERVATIANTALTSCTAVARTCAVGQNFGDLMSGSTAWTKSSTKTVTSASQLTGVAAQDALAAIQVAYTDADTLAKGLTEIDAGGLRVITWKQGAQTVVSYDYGAGDNTYGALFADGSTTLGAAINDGDFYGCSL